MDIDIKVGVLSGNVVKIIFNGIFIDSFSKVIFTGCHEFCAKKMGASELMFTPSDPEHDSFDIEDVTIGKDFHWQRNERQRFKGSLEILSDGKQATVVNIINIEQYLESVISSEMSANASLEFLKAHAVISRSWALARIRHTAPTHAQRQQREDCDERIVWYDNSGHTGFDVCADDHCQRYQGIARICNPNAVRAVRETSGMVLTYYGEIADTRFSKCCGGAFEAYENCWENSPHPYLGRGKDIAANERPVCSEHNKDLTIEVNAQRWIESNPPAFCNTSDKGALEQVLNGYDLETPDFFRWDVEYNAEELSIIVKERSGIDFGRITDIVPLQRGVSGRIVRMKLVGTKRSMIIGKELEIRRTLSNSHLYSSAFTVSKVYSDSRQNDKTSKSTPDVSTSIRENEMPEKFILHGAGWGHGVGLCQIGAASMASQSYSFRQILAHYYPGTQLTRF
ncbi:MAG: SpoIID/LytB domain-containing protein [Muribaculaceae bacterium]